MQSTTVDYDLDEVAERIGLRVGVSEVIYYCEISHKSTVYMECINGQWKAWRETYIPNKSKAISIKDIANGEYEFVIARLNQYLKFIRKIRSK